VVEASVRLEASFRSRYTCNDRPDRAARAAKFVMYVVVARGES
jgi:hypothetical protein